MVVPAQALSEPLPQRGYTHSARGFNPGEPPKPHRALKGRQTDGDKNVQKECNRHPFQRVH
jgi:hypothetical protein